MLSPLLSGSGLDLPGPLVAAGFADQARRARGRTPRVFRQDRDVLSKNPEKPADPAQSAGRNRRGVLSLGHAFFAQAKKGGSLAAASETRGRAESHSSDRLRLSATKDPSPAARDYKDRSNAINQMAFQKKT
jgi:hypothetical protein